MPRHKTTTITIEEAKARFEAWRQNRKGKTAIPDELWPAAAEVARREGVNRTSTELTCSWNWWRECNRFLNAQSNWKADAANCVFS
jgi:hypothetical protein